MGFLENIGGWELLVIFLLGVFIFGPDRLPKAISDGVAMVRQLRQMARNATGDLNRELGTNLELEDLHPKTFLRKHLLSEEEEAALRKPLTGLYEDLRRDLREVEHSAGGIASAINSVPTSIAAVDLGASTPSAPEEDGTAAAKEAVEPAVATAPAVRDAFDDDAT